MLDFTGLSPGQIAALAAAASLVAALISGSSALITALVNARATRTAAVVAERRAYRRELLRPFQEAHTAKLKALLEAQMSSDPLKAARAIFNQEADRTPLAMVVEPRVLDSFTTAGYWESRAREALIDVPEGYGLHVSQVISIVAHYAMAEDRLLKDLERFIFGEASHWWIVRHVRTYELSRDHQWWERQSQPIPLEELERDRKELEEFVVRAREARLNKLKRRNR